MSTKLPAAPDIVDELAPFVHVADVDRSAAFYASLGFVLNHSLADDAGRMFWCTMRAGRAHIMFARASAPVVAESQAVIFYMYCMGVEALRRRLLSAGLVDCGRYCGAPWTRDPRGEVFQISYPAHMPAGELRVHDPDGYCILVGQLR